MILLLLGLQELADALRATRAEKCYEATFTSVLAVGAGDPLKREGTVLWWKSGAQVVSYAGSGGERVQAVRAGTQFKCPKHEPVFRSTPCETCGEARMPTTLPRVWVLHSTEGWITADQANQASAASGFQNPDALLQLLEPHAGSATAAKGGWKIELKGEDAVKAARKLHPERDFQAKNAVFSILLTLHQGKVASLSVEASARTAEGAGTFAASAQLAKFGLVGIPDRVGKAALSKDVAEALAQQLR